MRLMVEGLGTWLCMFTGEGTSQKIVFLGSGGFIMRKLPSGREE